MEEEASDQRRCSSLPVFSRACCPLFTEVRGRGIPRTSPVYDSRKVEPPPAFLKVENKRSLLRRSLVALCRPWRPPRGDPKAKETATGPSPSGNSQLRLGLC